MERQGQAFVMPQEDTPDIVKAKAKLAKRKAQAKEKQQEQEERLTSLLELRNLQSEDADEFWVR